MPGFGQAVIGPPGSGKSTYCLGTSQFHRALGRSTVIINLDPANTHLMYTPHADITDLVNMETVARDLKLGPNGAMLYCMEYLEKNVEWLRERLLEVKGKYVLFDFPGQIELYTHNQCVRNVLRFLTGELDYRVCFACFFFGEIWEWFYFGGV